MNNTELKLDFRKCTEKDIDNALVKCAKKEVNTVVISNIYPAWFEERYNMEIDSENGFDMDWWGHLYLHEADIYGDKIELFGCCRYGYVRIKRKDKK